MRAIYILIGAPGVGKTTFLKNASQEINKSSTVDLMHSVVGPDTVRSIVASPLAKPDGTYGISQKNEKFVWSFINDVLERKVNRGELIIVDATHSRESAIAAYKKYSDRGYRVTAIDFRNEASIDEIIRRNNQRGYKVVPEDVVRTIHARTLALNIPKWVEVIEPRDFIKHFTDIKYNFNEFKNLVFIGDIHGCLDELKEVIAQAGVDPDNVVLGADGQYIKDKDTACIFIGDYFDRGQDVVGTFRYLQDLNKKYYTMFLRGNHEEPLLYYKMFMKDSIKSSLVYLEKIHLQTRERLMQASDELRVNNNIIEEHAGFVKATNRWIFGFLGAGTQYKKVEKYILETGIPNAQLEIERTSGELEIIQNLILTLRSMSYRDLDDWIESIRDKPEFELYSESIRKYNLPRNLVNDPDYGFHRIKRTSLDTIKSFLLSSISYKEINAFVKRTQQMFYADFHGRTIVATHGGLSDLPTKATPTDDMVRGVGSYEESVEVDETFHRLNPEAISIHGHRNMTNIPVMSSPGTYNINGDVDLGIRAVVFRVDEINPQEIEVQPNENTLKYFRKQQLIRAQRFNARKLTQEEEGKGLVRLFQDHEHVNVKKLPDNIASVNFTRTAFERGAWDAVTIKARGLFLSLSEDNNPENGDIIARGYEKFFNLGERNGFKERDIRELAYPIQAYEKANGYLGLLSVYETHQGLKWLISMKSTTEGDFAMNFKRMILPNLCDKLMQKLQKDNLTLVFEVIDPVFDPHMQEYKHQELVLLDGIKNKLDFETVDTKAREEYVELLRASVSDACPVRSKKLIQTCNNFNEFYILVSNAQKLDKLSADGIEGFVFEDASPQKHMFKIKTDWYSFWKYMRTQKHKIEQRVSTQYKKNKELPVILNINTINKLKQYLHSEEQILVWNFMLEWAQRDPEDFKKQSIIDVRKAFLVKYNQV